MFADQSCGVQSNAPTKYIALETCVLAVTCSGWNISQPLLCSGWDIFRIQIDKCLNDFNCINRLRDSRLKPQVNPDLDAPARSAINRRRVTGNPHIRHARQSR
ncbi:hypothetical protein GJ496_000361 [Pomphorhynchus laevis]|nr:hypothetical protein GJ496_000361 [Pomphorhynchus laevis]